jgi:uncharacterized protein
MLKKTYKYVLVFVLICLVFSSCKKDYSSNKEPIVENTIFGKCKIDDPIIVDLLNSPIMKRLKDVDQSGTPKYFMDLPAYSRYSHSVGVYYLLKKFKVSKKQRVAGLLHDASHTVFSHVGDWIFQRNYTDTYQDKIHQWYLEKVNVNQILNKYDLQLEDVLPDRPEFSCLEQDLPDMCADRIEYNLHTGLIFEKITKKQLKNIVEDLHFKNDRWYFTDPHLAKKLGMLSLYFTEKLWGPDWNFVICSWTASIVERAAELKIISLNEIHFGTDKEVLAKIYASDDPIILSLLKKCKNPYDYFERANFKEHSLVIKQKFRGMNPLVMIDGTLHKLTHLDKEYKEEYKRVKNKVVKGFPISFINKENNIANKKILKEEYELFVK